MTTNISSINFKQPSFEDYLNAKTLKELPFRVRARIINTFEYQQRRIAQRLEHTPYKCEIDGSNPSTPTKLARGDNVSVGSTAGAKSEPSLQVAPRVRLKKRIPKHEPRRPSSYRNSTTVQTSRRITRIHSSGKGRHSKRNKIALKRVSETIRRFKGGLDDGSGVKL
jgi:hypothetical protein